mmetsp:Transcript_24051/g.63601  ORF Transcript_24051/g.63601 Transcript_24051/m.63601 type:complete len:224 (-) Transcript_24051:266-937(-)
MIGDLVAGKMAGMVEPGQSPAEVRKMVDDWQKKREQTLAAILIKRCEQFVNGDEEGFEKHALTEKLVLVQETFGPDLIKAIGYVYKYKAQQLTGSYCTVLGIKGFFKTIHENGHMMRLKTQASQETYKAGMLNAIAQAQEMREYEEDKAADGAEARAKPAIDADKLKEQAFLTGMGATWVASLVDIETTLNKVVQIACVEGGKLNEPRTKAVEALGCIFYDEE